MPVYIPSVGDKGAFSAQAPFTLVSGRQYECIAVRNFDELERSQVKVFESVYVPAGLDLARFESDRSSCPIIVGLRSGLGEISYLPALYLNQAPALSGVEYHDVLVGVNLGPMPKQETLDGLKDKIRQLISDQLGIVAQVTLATRPTKQHIDQAQHDALVSARETVKTDTLQTIGSVAQLSYQNELLKKKVGAMVALLQGEGTFLLDGVETAAAQILGSIE
jgi:hypothetical protein